MLIFVVMIGSSVFFWHNVSAHPRPRCVRSRGRRVQRVLATHLYDLSGLDLDQGLLYQRQ